MECNKEEAQRAMDIAERKLSKNDYNGAKIFITKAKNLYPKLDGLKQVLTMINVYISASNKNNVGGESDWYRILGVDPLASDKTVKKQYKKLALLLHPDKNMYNGAEGAFKLVLEAWCLLSDKAKRNAYDQKRMSKETKPEKSSGMEQTPPKAYEPAPFHWATDATREEFYKWRQGALSRLDASREEFKKWRQGALSRLYADRKKLETLRAAARDANSLLSKQNGFSRIGRQVAT